MKVRWERVIAVFMLGIFLYLSFSLDPFLEDIFDVVNDPGGYEKPRYCFIGDTEKLIRKYQSMAHHIRPV